MIELDPKTTALILIDLQKGLLSMPLAPYSAGQIVDCARRLATHFKAAEAFVVLVRIEFAETYSDRLRQSVDIPMQFRAGGLPADWAELVPELAPYADVTITKRQWGAFYGTELDLQLRRRGLTTVVLGGVATNFGVETTAREAWQHNYSVIVAEDATSSVDTEMHQFSVQKILPRIARVRSVAEIKNALKITQD